MFVKRNASGDIVAISKMADGEICEYLPDRARELEGFIQSDKDHHQQLLVQSDLDMARVLEDVVNLLIERHIIRFTDLPEAAQSKLLSRRHLRNRNKEIDLLDESEDFKI